MGFNKISKNSVLFFFVISAFLILMNAGCTRKAGGISTLKISIPANFGSNKVTNLNYSETTTQQSVSAQSDDGAKWNSSLNPIMMSDVNCFLIAVAGPEADMQRNYCTTTSGETLKIGRWVGGIPSGASLSMEVPSGPSRQIMVVGFKGLAGSCTNFKSGNMNDQSLSEPHVVGVLTKDLTAGNVNVAVPVPISVFPANMLKIKDCKGPDFNSMGSAALYFGDQTTGSMPVTSNQSYSGLGGYSQQIVGLDFAPPAPDDLTVGIEVPSVGSFSMNDEVMIVIQGLSNGWYGSNNESASDCGYKAWDGRYAYARIKKTGSGIIYINKGTFLDNLDYNPVDGLHDLPIATNLVASPNPGNTFCHMKVLKVLSYNDLTVAPGVVITPDPFSYTGSGAGILPIRVNGTLYMGGGSIIGANGMGYPYSNGKSGDGVKGTDITACSGTGPNPTQTGGACAIGADGAGGGGHGNPLPVPYIQGTTYPSGPSGGKGGNPGNFDNGGGGAGEDCGDGTCWGSLAGKMYMGGAGGSNSSAMGGSGGGIVMLMARNIDIAAGATAFIKSQGMNGNVAFSTNGSPGGGAGGSILLGYKNLNLNSTGNLQVMADGGAAGASTGGSSGGGGGGGRTHIVACSTSLYPISTILKSVNGGAPSSFVANPGFAGSIGSQFGAPAGIDCSNLY
jgi:hypothetical protein